MQILGSSSSRALLTAQHVSGQHSGEINVAARSLRYDEIRSGYQRANALMTNSWSFSGCLTNLGTCDQHSDSAAVTPELCFSNAICSIRFQYDAGFIRKDWHYSVLNISIASSAILMRTAAETGCLFHMH